MKIRTLYWLTCLAMLLPGVASAQDRTLLFDTNAPGETKSIEHWGIDVTWPSFHNTRVSVLYMGQDIDMVRVAFLANQALINGELTAAQKAEMDAMANLANMAGPGKPWTMSIGTESGVDPWYKSGSQVIPSRWVQLMEASLNYYGTVHGRSISVTEPFNEPDYGWGQGTMQNLYDICALLQANPAFANTAISGASVLNADWANAWYNPIRTVVDEGSTHALAGSFNSYVSFLQNVSANGDVPSNPEAHNLVEVIVGAEYGMGSAIWWDAAELARSQFVRASKGKRLGYSEERGRWTAAAVYRAPDGKVQGFVGSSERMGQTTTYRFVSKDRNVFFNGEGPRRDFTVTIPQHHEKFINITWGEDVQSPVNGRYILVNRNSGKVMEVAGGSTADGANIQQNAYSGGAHQHWDVTPFSSPWMDQSFFSIKPVHSGKIADVAGGHLGDGGNLQQWIDLGGWNQLWFFEYVEDGWFHIRNRWSGRYLEVQDGSTANGANVRQWSLVTGGRTGAPAPNQQWRLLPMGAQVEFTAPAAPAGLHALAAPVSVSLSWNPSPEPDLAGYNVLRSDTAGGPFEIIARGLTDTTFTDNSANQARTYYYKVRGVDRALNRSNLSAEVAAAPSGNAALVARYEFEGNLADSSGNANHGLISGTALYQPGTVGAQALALNGTNHLNLPHEVVNFDQVTIAAWIYWSGGGAWQRIFDFGNGTGQNMFLTPQASGAGLRFAIRNGGGEQQLNAPALPINQWVHVAVTLGAPGARLYVNGVSVAESSAITIRPSDFQPVLNYLGKSQYATDPGFSGRIDDLRIFNHALHASQIAALASRLTPSEAWRLEHFGTTASAGDAADDADPDGDGVINLLERAFGGDPRRPDSSIAPAVDPLSPLLSILYRKAIDATDLTFTVMETTDLTTGWVPATGTIEVIEGDGAVEQLRFTREAGSAERLFLRVDVAGP
jgi:hypothetical protein